MNDIPRASNPPLNLAVVARFVIYWMPEETSSDTDFSFFTFKRSLHLNAAVNFLGLKPDFSYPLSSQFRSLAHNKYTSDFNEIYKKYTQRSLAYTYNKSHQSKKIIIYILILNKYGHYFWRGVYISDFYINFKLNISTNTNIPYFLQRT